MRVWKLTSCPFPFQRQCEEVSRKWLPLTDIMCVSGSSSKHSFLSLGSVWKIGALNSIFTRWSPKRRSLNRTFTLAWLSCTKHTITKCIYFSKGLIFTGLHMMSHDMPKRMVDPVQFTVYLPHNNWLPVERDLFLGSQWSIYLVNIWLSVKFS